MKRILALVSLLIITCSANAALINYPPDRIVPVFKGGVDVGLTGGWFEPTYHQIGLVIRDNSYSNPDQPNGKAIDVDSSYFFGYGAYLGWRFACSANDVRLHYFYLNSCDNKAYAAKSSDPQILWAVEGMLDDEQYISKVWRAKGKIEYKLQRWDLEFAQYMNFCLRASMRFFLGVSYHCLEKDRFIDYIGDNTSETDEGKREVINIDSEFEGWGPRIGVDFSYAMNYGFGLVGSLSSAMLYGEVCSDTKVKRVDADSMGQENAKISLQRCMIVPNIDLKLGLDYSYCFSNGNVARAEIGWWISSYINAVNDTHFVARANSANHINQLDNITYNGFYLTLAFHGG